MLATAMLPTEVIPDWLRPIRIATTSTPAAAAAGPAAPRRSARYAFHASVRKSATSSATPSRPELEEGADVGVLGEAALEREEPVDEDPVLGAEAVAEQRSLRSLADRAGPGLGAAARAEAASAEPAGSRRRTADGRARPRAERRSARRSPPFEPGLPAAAGAAGAAETQLRGRLEPRRLRADQREDHERGACAELRPDAKGRGRPRSGSPLRSPRRPRRASPRPRSRPAKRRTRPRRPGAPSPGRRARARRRAAARRRGASTPCSGSRRGRGIASPRPTVAESTASWCETASMRREPIATARDPGQDASEDAGRGHLRVRRAQREGDCSHEEDAECEDAPDR